MTFADWLDELENFSTRRERAIDDLGKHYEMWLRAAYNQALEDAAERVRQLLARLPDDRDPALVAADVQATIRELKR